ncbi:citrate lyase subunit alpha [Proteiniclasticum sp. SCR006]|uniref:Citrate lyase alpha chain n=1 Tax=Proteiniclasticum aestuarii TaxID=2817862 RepID=A0A939H5G0_9CLOT|nr:citrate lyase subunit alpha [Proteiniclasticum aestuarii]MBO1264519.1 citrate lyase subunit alpha [Proteiniclasticum aestuarii]
MINKVKRDIPDQFLVHDVEVFQGQYYREGYEYRKAAPKVKASIRPQESKVVSDLKEAIIKSELRDGMTVSFHHHFRDGDYIVNMVMDAIHEMGIRDITVCASSLGTAHAPIVRYIEDGTITGISSSGVRGEIGEAISEGKLKNPAYIRCHGGRVRAIETGDIHIDVAFIGAPTSDLYGNARGKGGKSDCGVLSYSMVDAEYADKVVVITDTLVPFPNFPPSIKQVDVDYVVVVPEIGNPRKIANELLRFTTDPRELLIAEYATKALVSTPYFRDGFSFQTGGGGPSLAVTRFLKPYMVEKDIRMGFAIGGITKPMIDLMEEGLIGTIVDAQDFDLTSIASVHNHPRHFEISTSQYANPMNKGAFVNKLDFVILGALEVDTDFNVNVVTGSDGVVRGAPGGHVDTAAGSKCSIIVAPLVRSRIPTIKDSVITVTTPGESVDIVVTEVGVAVNPARTDLLEALKDSGLPLMTIEKLRDEAYQLVGKPEEIQFEDEVVALVEYRDGTLIDVVRKPKKIT